MGGAGRRIAPPSQAGVGFKLWLGSPVWFCWSLGRHETKLRRKQGPTGRGVAIKSAMLGKFYISRGLVELFDRDVPSWSRACAHTSGATAARCWLERNGMEGHQPRQRHKRPSATHAPAPPPSAVAVPLSTLGVNCKAASPALSLSTHPVRGATPSSISPTAALE